MVGAESLGTGCQPVSTTNGATNKGDVDDKQAERNEVDTTNQKLSAPERSEKPTPGIETPGEPADRLVATPCRAPNQVEPKPGCEADAVSEAPSSEAVTPTALESNSPSPSTVPSVGDRSIPKPNPRDLRISEQAADARLRRVFQPSLRTGTYKVSDSLLAQYKKTGKSRKSLMKIFETCGYDKDGVIRESVGIFLSSLKSIQI